MQKLAVLICLLFLFSYLPVQVHAFKPLANVYVDDNAAIGWYDATHVHTIQEGVDNATVGGTVYVYDGTYSNFTVNKSVIIIGNSTSITHVVYGIVGGIETRVNVVTNNITMSNIDFDIQITNEKNRNAPLDGYDCSDLYIHDCSFETFSIVVYPLQTGSHGVPVYPPATNNIHISHNVFSVSAEGIGLNCINNSVIDYNTVHGGWVLGIGITFGNNNNILYNTVDGAGEGIFCASNNSVVSHNIITNMTDAGMEFASVNGIVSYNTIVNCSFVGLAVEYGSGNNIFNNQITDNNYGILAISSNGNVIYNNYLNNTINANDTGGTNNIWNISKTLGMNIMGGPYLGGNYYSDYTGTDANNDGIGDTQYNIPGNSSSIDYYPFVPYTAHVTTALVTDFYWTPTYPNTNDTVTFIDNTQSTDVVSWTWNLGDGTTRNTQTTSHVYTTAGYYDITLTITDNLGRTDSKTKSLYIGEQPHNPPIEIAKYPGFTVPEMYQLMGADKLPPTTNSVKIMVIDTGVTQRLYNGIDLNKIKIEYNHIYKNGIDETGHGTWCNYAVAYLLQTKDPNAVEISYRMLDANGGCTTQTFLDALDQALKDGVDVVSISAGSDFGNPNDPLAKKCDELKRAGIIVIVATGNKGPTASSIASPGVSDSVIAVGADDPQWYGPIMNQARLNGILNLKDDTIAYWSSRGPVRGVSYYKPDVVAPGESIIGPWLSDEKIVSGTSMATPLVAAGVALIVAENKDLIDQAKSSLWYDKSAISNAMEDALKESAYPKGDKNAWGAGIVQLDKANDLFKQKMQNIIAGGIIIPIVLVVFLVLIGFAVYRTYRKRSKKAWWAK